MSGFMAIIEFGVLASIGDFHVSFWLTIITLLILQCLEELLVGLCKVFPGLEGGLTQPLSSHL